MNKIYFDSTQREDIEKNLRSHLIELQDFLERLKQEETRELSVSLSGFLELISIESKK